MKKLTLTALILAAITPAVMAQETNKPIAIPDTIVAVKEKNKEIKSIAAPEMKDKLNKKFKNLKVTEVRYLPDLKLYEFQTENVPSLSYTNEDLSFFIYANKIIDPINFENIAQERSFKLYANMVKKASENPNEIKLILGDPNAKNRRNILIFSDPDCPFCKDIDKDLHQNFSNENVTITYYMNPLWELPGHEEAPEKAAIVWCAPDKNKAWENLMLVGLLPANTGDCENPTKEHSKLARLHNFSTTPTLIFDNGYIITGRATLDEIRTKLAQPGVRPD